jgi:hypothetical protein
LGIECCTNKLAAVAATHAPPTLPWFVKQNTIDWQAKKEDKAAQRVDKAQVRLDKAQVRFDAFLGRKSGGFGGLQLPQLGGFGGGDDGAQADAIGGMQPGGVPNLPFLP